MRAFKSRFTPVLLLIIPLLVAACSGGQAAQESDDEPTVPATSEPTVPAAGEAAAPATSEPTAAVAEGGEFELSENYEFDGFGFSMAIPAGWHADTRREVTFINELESDHATAFREEPPPREGYQIALDHRDAAFMATIGLGEDPTLQDLFELNKEFFDWQEPIEVSETEAFGAPALAAKAFDGEDWGYSLMGFANDEAFLLSLGAPSEEALDAFLPTFEQIVSSIAPAE